MRFQFQIFSLLIAGLGFSSLATAKAPAPNVAPKPAAAAKAPELNPPPERPWFYEDDNLFGRSFDKTSLKILGFGVLTSLSVSGEDNRVKDTYGDHQLMDRNTEQIGNALGTGIPGILVALGQLQWDRENGESHMKSIVATTVWTYVFKTAISRKRPGSSRNRQSWPSGHTSTIATTTGSLWYAYGWKVGVPMTALSVFTAASRIAGDHHFLSDVVGGAVVGVWMARAYANQTKTSQDVSESSAAEKPQMMIVPSFGNETLFLSLLYDY